ncbi:hypothetical protein E4T56_gene18068, partial [Termitomyces sp. T112]
GIPRLVLFGFPFASCVIEPQPPEVTLTRSKASYTLVPSSFIPVDVKFNIDN